MSLYNPTYIQHLYEAGIIDYNRYNALQQGIKIRQQQIAEFQRRVLEQNAVLESTQAGDNRVAYPPQIPKTNVSENVPQQDLNLDDDPLKRLEREREQELMGSQGTQRPQVQQQVPVQQAPSQEEQQEHELEQRCLEQQRQQLLRMQQMQQQIQQERIRRQRQQLIQQQIQKELRPETKQERKKRKQLAKKKQEEELQRRLAEKRAEQTQVPVNQTNNQMDNENEVEPEENIVENIQLVQRESTLVKDILNKLN